METQMRSIRCKKGVLVPTDFYLQTQTVLRTGCTGGILCGSLSGKEEGKRTCVHANPLKDTAHSVANTDETYK